MYFIKYHKRKILLLLSLFFIVAAIIFIISEKTSKHSPITIKVTTFKKSTSTPSSIIINNPVRIQYNVNTIKPNAYKNPIGEISNTNKHANFKQIINQPSSTEEIKKTSEPTNELAIISDNISNTKTKDNVSDEHVFASESKKNDETANTIEVSENDAGYKLNQALLVLKSGDTLTAIDQMNEIAKENKKFVAVWHHLSLCYLGLNEKLKAVRSLNKLEKSVFNVKTKKRLNQVIDHANHEDFEGAIKILKELKSDE